MWMEGCISMFKDPDKHAHISICARTRAHTLTHINMHTHMHTHKKCTHTRKHVQNASANTRTHAGQSLTSLLAGAAAGDAASKAAGARCLLPVLRAYGRMMLEDGLFHADPHPVIAAPPPCCCSTRGTPTGTCTCAYAHMHTGVVQGTRQSGTHAHACSTEITSASANTNRQTLKLSMYAGLPACLLGYCPGWGAR